MEKIENFASRKLMIKRKRDEINDIMEGQSKKAQSVYDCLDKAITNLGIKSLKIMRLQYFRSEIIKVNILHEFILHMN